MSPDKGRGRAADPADPPAVPHNATSSLTPASEWKSIRITTSTVIQTAVASSLFHLYYTGRAAAGDTAPSAVVLHTLPLHPTSADAASQRSALNKKAAHASLCKLISIVEIIKREFRTYQLEARREEGQERARKQREKRLGLVQSNTDLENGHTEGDNQPPRIAGSLQKRRRIDAGESGTLSDARPEANWGEGADEEEALDTPGGEHISSFTDPLPSKRPVMRIYAYNQLDTWENLRSTGQTDGSGQEAAAAPEAYQSFAAEELDQAIQNQVARGRKRPSKAHTPVMRITLSTVRLPTLEKALRAGKAQDAAIEIPPETQAGGVSSAASWTLQYPAAVKAKRPRTRKKKAGAIVTATAVTGKNARPDQPTETARTIASQTFDTTVADRMLASGDAEMDIASPALLARA